MRVHPAVLRPPCAARGVRSGDPQPAVGDQLIGPGLLALSSQDIAPDSLRRALGEVFARPDYQWVERRQPLLWLVNLWQSLMDWFDRLADQHPAGFNVLLWVMTALLVALLVHVGWVVWRIVRTSSRAAGAAASGAGGIVMDAGTHRSRADELARAGRYAEALGHRFLAVVLELDQAEALRFHTSKTPAEYVGEVRLDDQGRATFAELVARLYRHLFGAVPCDEAEYRVFGSTAEQLTRHVVPA